jgi:enoyl-CoA hydratase/carnithine racemase
MNATTVNAQLDGRVLIVYLDNPPRNLMTPGMVKELDVLTCSIERDRMIRAVVITSASPDAFLTHFDAEALLANAQVTPGELSVWQASIVLRATSALGHVPGLGTLLDHSLLSGTRALLRLNKLFLRWNQMDKAFIAAINGLALGGGCELALACDLRYMMDNEYCRIGLPEAAFGIIPGGGGSQRLARLLGSGQALELLLEGRTLNATEAVAIGLAHRAIPPGRLLEEAHQTAERLARRSPVTVAAIKHAIYKGGSRSLRNGLHIEQAEFLAVTSSSRGQQGMSELLRRYPSNSPLPSVELLAQLPEWQRGEAIDLGEK